MMTDCPTRIIFESATRRAQRRHRGAAMVLVVTVVAIASILGYAMLATASLKTQIADNGVQIVRADCLAESGINLGMYYLRHMDEPQLASLKTTGALAMTDISLGAGIAGAFDLSINRIYTRDAANNPVATNDYEVIAVGHSRTDGNSGTQTLKAIVRVLHRFRARYALSANGPTTIGGTTQVLQGPSFGTGPYDFVRAIQSSGPVTVGFGATVDGDIAAPDLAIGPGASFSGNLFEPSGEFAAPLRSTNQHLAWGDLKVYGPSYTFNEKTWTAQVIGGTILTLPPYDPAINPLGIYYSPTDLTILNTTSYNLATVIDGSLIVNGNLTIGADSFNDPRTLTINSNGGGPGLLVKGDLVYAADSQQKNLVVNGLAYVGGTVQGSSGSDTCSLTINGAMLVACGPTGAVQPFDPLFEGAIVLQYAPELIDIPDFCNNSNQDVEAIALIHFSSPMLTQEMQ